MFRSLKNYGDKFLMKSHIVRISFFIFSFMNDRQITNSISTIKQMKRTFLLQSLFRSCIDTTTYAEKLKKWIKGFWCNKLHNIHSVN